MKIYTCFSDRNAVIALGLFLLLSAGRTFAESQNLPFLVLSRDFVVTCVDKTELKESVRGVGLFSIGQRKLYLIYRIIGQENPLFERSVVFNSKRLEIVSPDEFYFAFLFKDSESVSHFYYCSLFAVQKEFAPQFWNSSAGGIEMYQDLNKAITYVMSQLGQCLLNQIIIGNEVDKAPTLYL